jgi:hypothetical protein
LPSTRSAGYAFYMATSLSSRRRLALASALRGGGLPEEALAMFRTWGRQGGEARKRALYAGERSAQGRKAVAARWSRRPATGAADTSRR